MSKHFSNILLVIIICFCCNNVFSQQDIGYDDLMIKSEQYIYEEPNKAIPYLIKALNIANNDDDLDRITASTIQLSIAYFTTTQYDEVLNLINNYLIEYEDDISSSELCKFYNLLGGIFYDMDSYEVSLDYFNKALDFAKEGNNTQLIGKIYMNLGHIHSNFKNIDDAFSNYKKSLEIATRNTDTIALIYSNNALGSSYLKKELLNEADEHFNIALHLAKQKKFTRGYINSMVRLGDLSLKRNQIKLAEGYYETILNDDRITAYDKARLIIKLGDIAELKNSVETTIKHYDSAFTMAKEIPSLELQKEASLKLSTVYEKNEQYKQSLEHSKHYHKIYDSIYNTNVAYKIKSNEFLSSDKNRKEIKAKTSLFSKILIVLISLSFIILAYLFYMRNKKQKLIIENKELQIQLNEEREDQLKQDISSKNNEIVQKVLRINSDDSFKKNLLEELVLLKELPKTDLNAKLKTIINDIKLSNNENFWDEFKMHFNKVHPEFYKTLIEAHPSLTPNERKLCGYIRLNMSIKEISQLTKQTTNSIKIARSRLRKKLNIVGVKISLTEFLSQY